MEQLRGLEVLMKSILGWRSGPAAPFISGTSLHWSERSQKDELLPKSSSADGAGPGSAALADTDTELRWEQI